MERLHVERRALLVAAALSSLGFDAEASTPSRASLFVILRSKNANVVHYDARLTHAGVLDPAQPIAAHWIMHAEDGRGEALTWLERKFAYGWSASRDAHGDVLVRLRAFAKREIRVFRDEKGDFRALARILDRAALLERIYVSSDDRGLTPSVRYVELFGVSRTDGRRVSERIVP